MGQGRKLQAVRGGKKTVQGACGVRDEGKRTRKKEQRMRNSAQGAGRRR